MSSWARAMRKPSDLGFDDDGFVLPPLETRPHLVEAPHPQPGTLFDVPARGLPEEREEARRTITERCEQAAELLADAQPGCRLVPAQRRRQPAHEADRRRGARCPGPTRRTRRKPSWPRSAAGEIRVLVTKPKIGAWGLNWQHCHRMTFFPSHSYEQYYQAVRRCWRFGQKHPVTVDIVTTEGGANVFRNLERKAAQADRMFESP